MSSACAADTALCTPWAAPLAPPQAAPMSAPIAAPPGIGSNAPIATPAAPPITAPRALTFDRIRALLCGQVLAELGRILRSAADHIEHAHQQDEDSAHGIHPAYRFVAVHVPLHTHEIVPRPEPAPLLETAFPLSSRLSVTVKTAGGSTRGRDGAPHATITGN